MSETFDRVRSLLARTARRAQARLAGTSIGSVRERLRDLARGKSTISDVALTAALARAPHVQSITTACGEGNIHIDAAFEDGSNMTVLLRPNLVSFAPRGAKEIGFGIEPPELANDPRTADLAGALGAAIAKTIWSPVLAGVDMEAPIVEREAGQVRMDLRSIRAVNAQLGHAVLGPLLETLALASLEAGPGALVLKLKLPML